MMVPLKRQIRKALIEKALSYSKAQETDIYLSAQDLGLSRFAGGAIHQNVAHSDITLNIRSVAVKRLGRATTNDLSDSGVQKAVESAHLSSVIGSKGHRCRDCAQQRMGEYRRT